MGLHLHLNRPARVSAHGCMVSRFVGRGNDLIRSSNDEHLSLTHGSIVEVGIVSIISRVHLKNSGYVITSAAIS